MKKLAMVPVLMMMIPNLVSAQVAESAPNARAFINRLARIDGQNETALKGKELHASLFRKDGKAFFKISLLDCSKELALDADCEPGTVLKSVTDELDLTKNTSLGDPGSLRSKVSVHENATDLWNGPIAYSADQIVLKTKDGKEHSDIVEIAPRLAVHGMWISRSNSPKVRRGEPLLLTHIALSNHGGKLAKMPATITLAGGHKFSIPDVSIVDSKSIVISVRDKGIGASVGENGYYVTSTVATVVAGGINQILPVSELPDYVDFSGDYAPTPYGRMRQGLHAAARNEGLQPFLSLPHLSVPVISVAKVEALNPIEWAMLAIKQKSYKSTAKVTLSAIGHFLPGDRLVAKLESPYAVLLDPTGEVVKRMTIAIKSPTQKV
ncbi:MAG: hypothetical protein V4760_12980, partial [Bdellovibrionota bacterium]